MTIFGKPLSAYFTFAKVFIILILATGVVRLALSLNGVPDATTRWFTMTGLIWIGVIYLSIRVHTSGFGSYKQLLVLCALLDWAAQAISVIGIAIAIATDTNNVFSAPEAAFGGDGKTWMHLGSHLVVGTTLGALVPWGIGSIILAITRKRYRKFTNFESTSMERS